MKASLPNFLSSPFSEISPDFQPVSPFPELFLHYPEICNISHACSIIVK